MQVSIDIFHIKIHCAFSLISIVAKVKIKLKTYNSFYCKSLQVIGCVKLVKVFHVHKLVSNVYGSLRARLQQIFR